MDPHQLSMKMGLSYSRFMRYIKWLLFVDWIEMTDDGFIGLRLTDTGITIHDKLRSNSNSDDQKRGHSSLIVLTCRIYTIL